MIRELSLCSCDMLHFSPLLLSLLKSSFSCGQCSDGWPGQAFPAGGTMPDSRKSGPGPGKPTMNEVELELKSGSRLFFTWVEAREIDGQSLHQRL